MRRAGLCICDNGTLGHPNFKDEPMLHQLPRSRSAKRPPVAKPKETKQQREKRLKKGRAKKLELRERLLAEDDDAVLTFSEWCSLSGFSLRVGRYVIKRGDGPTITKLSDRRIGVSRKHHREWLEKRARQ
jgi:hypothetical protein